MTVAATADPATSTQRWRWSTSRGRVRAMLEQQQITRGDAEYDRFWWRTPTPAPNPRDRTVMARALFFLFPWRKHQYPGNHRCIQSVLGLLDRSTIRYWRSGRQRPSPEYVDLLASHLEAKGAQALELARLLRQELAERPDGRRKHPGGRFMRGVQRPAREG